MGRVKHITKEERFAIQVGLESGRKISTIAKELNPQSIYSSFKLGLTSTGMKRYFKIYLRALHLIQS